MKFHENPSSGSRVGPFGRTDRHDEANGHFPASTNAPNKQLIRINEAQHVAVKCATRPTCSVSRKGGECVLILKENLEEKMI